VGAVEPVGHVGDAPGPGDVVVAGLDGRIERSALFRRDRRGRPAVAVVERTDS
jgi:hypothetical protein